MTPERWCQIEELFHSALEHDAERRVTFLDEACADDADLLQLVGELLASFQEAGNFIDKTPFDGAISAIADAFTEEDSREAAGNAELIGRTIGHYEIQSFLGAGGMGVVYLARDLKLGRQIAIKLLPARFTNDTAQVQRFECEASAASGLNHPNIITIHEITREGDTHFIATEFVAGQTLREKITSEPISVSEILRIAVQIADALTAAHAAGIVHRDIKPENVMVRPDGLVKVLDFGLAKPSPQESIPTTGPGTAAATMRTDPAMLMGTIAYLSPEQVLRQDIDRRTDIFSLGVVLYELVTGTRPFAGTGATDICDAIVCNAPATIERGDVPEALKRIINRALSKDRSERYQSADEMRKELNRLVPQASTASTDWFPVSQSRVALGLGVLTVLIVVLALGLGREAEPDVSSFSTGPIKRITDAAGQEIFPSLSPDGKSIVYASRAAGTWDIYLQEIGETEATNLTPDGRHVDLAPAFSPDGKRIVFSSSREGEGIFLMDRDGRNLVRLSPDGYNPAWSPDANEIAAADDRIFDYEGRNHNHSQLFAVNVQTGVRRRITDGDAVQPNWSPHGHRIAYWGVHKGGQRDIWTVPASGGEPVAVTNDREVDWNPVWSRDGKYLYFLSDRGGSMNLWRMPIDELSGKVVGQIEPATLPSAKIQHISFSADGRTLVYAETNRRENTWQIGFDPVAAAVKGQAVQLTHGIRRYSQPDLSPDERSLAFVSVAESQEDLFIINPEGSGLRQLTNDSAQDRTPRWSPDSRQIAFLSDRSGKYEIWKVNQDGGGLEQLSNVPEADVANPVWSPDGRQLLFKVAPHNCVIVEVGSPKRPQRSLAGPPVSGFLPWSWSPDGKLLAGWQFDPQRHTGGVIVYSFVDGHYDLQPNRGMSPVWLNDSRRLISVDVGKMYLYDTLSRQWREIYNIEPNGFGTFTLSRDNRRLYYSVISSEADIWMLSVE
jgi:Tol biopolymer transport system component